MITTPTDGPPPLIRCTLDEFREEVPVQTNLSFAVRFRVALRRNIEEDQLAKVYLVDDEQCTPFYAPHFANIGTYINST